MPAMSAKNQWNLQTVFQNSRVHCLDDVQGIERVQLAHGLYYRLTWRDDRGWQKPKNFDWSPQAEIIRGAHATTDVGVTGILATRMVVPGEYVGIYAKMTHQEGTEWLHHTVNLAAAGPKNWGGVLFELKARCTRQKLTSGGTEAEDELVRQGFATHYGKGKEGRWQVPFAFLQMVGIWVPCTGNLCDALPGCKSE